MLDHVCITVRDLDEILFITGRGRNRIADGVLSFPMGPRVGGHPPFWRFLSSKGFELFSARFRSNSCLSC